MPEKYLSTLGIIANFFIAIMIALGFKSRLDATDKRHTNFVDTVGSEVIWESRFKEFKDGLGDRLDKLDESVQKNSAETRDLFEKLYSHLPKRSSDDGG